MICWNSKNLSPPPYVTLPLEKTVAKKDTFRTTRQVLQDTAKYAKEHVPYLTTDIFILDRFMYKLHRRLKTQKFMSHVKQMSKCFARFRGIDIETLLHNLSESWPSDDDVRIADRHVYVPSRQQIHYHMMRVVGATQLLRQAAAHALLTFNLCMEQIHTGMLINQMIVIVATSSRLWCLCNSFTKRFSELYNQLQTLTPELQATAVEWISVDDLPASMGEIADIEGLDEMEIEMKRKKSQLDKLFEKFITKDDPEPTRSETVSTSAKGEEAISEDTGLPAEKSEKLDPVPSASSLEDLGLPIQRKQARYASNKSASSEDIGLPIDRKKISLVQSNVTSEDPGSPIGRKQKQSTVPAIDQTEKKPKKRKLRDTNSKTKGAKKTMDTSGEEVNEKDENYREPLATSTPAASHPSAQTSLETGAIPALEDLTAAAENEGEVDSATSDYAFREFMIQMHECKSLPKLQKVITNNKTMIEKRAKDKFELCLKKVKKLKMKSKELEEKDERKKLLKKAKTLLAKELNNDGDIDDKPCVQRSPKKNRNMLVLSNKKEIHRIISDAVRREHGVDALYQKLQQKHGKFQVGEKVYRMEPQSMESLKENARKLCISKTSKRVNVPIIAKTLLAIFKQAIIGSKTRDDKPKKKGGQEDGSHQPSSPVRKKLKNKQTLNLSEKKRKKKKISSTE